MTISRNERLAALARAVGLDASLFDEQGHAGLQIEDVILHLQYFEEDGEQVLVMAADLGAIAPQARAQAYPLMLTANASWRSVAGGALALDEQGGNAMLFLRLDMREVDDQALAQRVYAFTDAALSWRGKLAELPGQGAAQPRPVPQAGSAPINLA